jgi:hypothetical protein
VDQGLSITRNVFSRNEPDALVSLADYHVVLHPQFAYAPQLAALTHQEYSNYLASLPELPHEFVTGLHAASLYDNQGFRAIAVLDAFREFHRPRPAFFGSVQQHELGDLLDSARDVLLRAVRERPVEKASAGLYVFARHLEHAARDLQAERLPYSHEQPTFVHPVLPGFGQHERAA